MTKVYHDVQALLDALAEFIVEKYHASVKNSNRFSLVLSGGSSPKKLYELLASEKYKDKIDWAKVFFFFGDERYVPLDHADSNYRMARIALFEPLNISPENVFAVNTSLTPENAAANYEQQIKTYIGNAAQTFDFTLLGLGDDAHTASLFPGTQVLHEKIAWVKETWIEKVKMNRITLTAPLINKSKTVAFLVYGSSKATAIQNIFKQQRNVDQYPAQLIQPEKSEVVWFVDKDAAALIS